MDTRLTVLITCKNEQHNIRACIESARPIADEILVADSGSTDRTKEIVREIGGCRLVERDIYVSAGNFKNWALPNATYQWVLVVDSDERVTPELAEEVRRTLAGPPKFDAYRIRFQTYFLGQRVKFCGWNTSTSVRLFRREVCNYREMRVHSDVDVHTGSVGRLKGKFLHFTCPDLTQYMEKVNRYTQWAAQSMFEKGRRVGALGLILRGPLRFLQMYFIRGGFLDGRVGLVVCGTTAYYTFMKYTKLWELQQRNAMYGVSDEAKIRLREGGESRQHAEQTQCAKAA